MIVGIDYTILFIFENQVKALYQFDNIYSLMEIFQALEKEKRKKKQAYALGI